jgi:hypothetical protein
VFWVFLVGIKPTCAPFAIFGLVWLIHRVGLKTCFKWSPVLFLLTLPASIWFIKNAWLYGSPLYPYVGGPNIAPLIPSEVLAQLPSRSWSEKLWGYIWVVFADHRYVLSLGFWPLFSLPFLLIKKHNTKILTICVISGLLLTLLMTPFKNRYMMPFLFCYLPTMAILLKKSPLIVRLCLYGTVLFNGISFSPYLAQPLYATIKGWNVDDFYGFKFYNYQAYQNVRNLPKGKILLVGQASHWLKRPHILSVISETHLDYTRLKSIDDLLDFIHANEIRHIVFDWRDVHGMAESTNPWYAKKSYCAQKALLWMKALEQHPHISFQFEQSGVRVMSLKDK